MKYIKKTAASILDGWASFSLNPPGDYTKMVITDPNGISRIAWQKTGENLRNAISKVGGEIGNSQKRV
jgi:hypothetical protein